MTKRTCCWMVWGSSCSTVQPTDLQVPRISFTVPLNSLAQLRSRITRAISITSSRARLPLCLMFFSCRGYQNHVSGSSSINRPQDLLWMKAFLCQHSSPQNISHTILRTLARESVNNSPRQQGQPV